MPEQINSGPIRKTKDDIPRSKSQIVTNSDDKITTLRRGTRLRKLSKKITGIYTTNSPQALIAKFEEHEPKNIK